MKFFQARKNGKNNISIFTNAQAGFAATFLPERQGVAFSGPGYWNGIGYTGILPTPSHYTMQSINQSINHSLTQSVTHSINQSIHHSINQSINPSINQSINPSLDQSINHSFNQWINHSVNQSTNQSINYEVNEVNILWNTLDGKDHHKIL